MGYSTLIVFNHFIENLNRVLSFYFLYFSSHFDVHLGSFANKISRFVSKIFLLVMLHRHRVLLPLF